MKHDTSLPAQPQPFFLVFIVLLCSIFLHYISYIFSSWNSNRLGPCVVFLTHKNTKKGHIIKTHNRCESIKRELKQKRKKKTFWSSLANVYCTSVFLLYNQMVSPQSPFQYWMRSWLDVSKAEVQPDKVLQNIPFIVPFPLQGQQRW